MPRNQAIELTDFDGSFVVVSPIDGRRCRVLESNVAEPDEILIKSTDLPWDEADLDIGGSTRLAPSDLEEAGDEDAEEGDDESLFSGSILEEMEDPDGFVRDTHEKVDARSEGSQPEWIPRARPPQWGDADADPTALALRLLIHYLAHHEGYSGVRRRVEVCRCSRYAPGEDLTLASLHAIVYAMVRKKRAPGLGRIQKAIVQAVRNQAQETPELFSKAA